MSAIAIPTKNPGEVYIPSLGKTFQQVELREDDVFDNIVIPSGAIAAGTEFVFFRDLTNKNEQDTNIPTQKRIASGDEVAVFRIGIHPREAIGTALPTFNDMRKVLGNGQLDVKFNRRQISTGPMIKYPSGYGMGGYSDETGATAVTVGVPSVAAAPTLFVPQQLKDDDDLNCRLRFPDASWVSGYAAPTLGAAVKIALLLHGVMKNPLGK